MEYSIHPIALWCVASPVTIGNFHLKWSTRVNADKVGSVGLEMAGSGRVEEIVGKLLVVLLFLLALGFIGVSLLFPGALLVCSPAFGPTLLRYVTKFVAVITLDL